MSKCINSKGVATKTADNPTYGSQSKQELPGPLALSVGDLVAVIDDGKRLQELSIRARDVNKRGVGLMIELAEILKEAHSIYCRVGRDGEFSAWVRENLPDLSQRTAQRYIRVHGSFGKVDRQTLTKFEPTALYLLSEVNTPSYARELALDVAAKGVQVTAAVARQFVSVVGKKTLPLAKGPAPQRINTSAGEIIIRPVAGVLNVVDALHEAIAKHTGDRDDSPNTCTS